MGFKKMWFVRGSSQKIRIGRLILLKIKKKKNTVQQNIYMYNAYLSTKKM